MERVAPAEGSALRRAARSARDLDQRVGGPPLPSAVLLRGMVFWSRLHGLVSLELDRHITSMRPDPGLLYRAEIAELGAET